MSELRKNRLKTWHYLHCSMGGSYWVPCKILSRNGDQVTIEYFDFIVNDNMEWEVDSDRVKLMSPE